MLAACGYFHGECDGGSFGEVLYGHADGESECGVVCSGITADGGCSEGEAYGESLGDVVDGDGEEEAGGLVYFDVGAFFMACAGVEVGQEVVEDDEEESAQEEAYGGGQP